MNDPKNKDVVKKWESAGMKKEKIDDPTPS